VVGDNMKKYECMMCGYIYDESLGDPDEGIAPGTAWEDIPEDWYCPVCGASKEDFEMVEI
jgi:rubredoxin